MYSFKNKEKINTDSKAREGNLMNKLSLKKNIIFFSVMRLTGPVILRLHLFRIGYYKKLDKNILIALLATTPISLLIPYVMKEVIESFFSDYIIYLKSLLIIIQAYLTIIYITKLYLNKE